MSDNDIRRLYQGGFHEEAFNQIVNSYSERLYYHIRRFIHNHTDADDVLQEIFIKIWTALPTFRWEAQLFTWIYRIATNATLNYLRKEKFKSIISFQDFTKKMEERIDEDAYFNGEELERELHKAMQRLPEKQRMAFALRYFEQMKYEDIAQITDTSVGALKTSYHIAYKKISEELKQIFG